MSDRVQQAARAALANAKAGNRERPAPIESAPAFNNDSGKWITPAPGHSTPAPTGGLSEETVRGLESAIKAQEAMTKAAATQAATTEKKKLTEKELADLLLIDRPTAARVYQLINPEEDYTPERKVIESRVSEIDIGEFLMNGTVTQSVPIIPNKLVVTYQSIVDAVESFIDRRMAEEAARIHKERQVYGSGDDADITTREYMRRQNEYALAVYINTYDGTRWPSLTTANGTINEDAIDKRLAMVSKLPSPVFVLLLNNLGWFVERMQKAISVAVLGNG